MVNVVTKIKEIVLRIHSVKTSALPEGVKRLESPREIKIARDARWDIAKGKGKKRSHDEDEESEVFNSIISTEYDAEFEEFKQFQRFKDHRRRAQEEVASVNHTHIAGPTSSSSAGAGFFCPTCEIMRIDINFCVSCGYHLGSVSDY